MEGRKFDAVCLYKSILPLSILEGILLALAVGTKLITLYMLPTIVFVFLWNIRSQMVYLTIRGGRDKVLRLVLTQALIFMLMFATAFVFFTVINPALWSNPVYNCWKIVDYWANFTKACSRLFAEGITTFSSRLGLIYRRGILLEVHDTPYPHFEIIYVFVFLLGSWIMARRTVDEMKKCYFAGPYTILSIWTIVTFGTWILTLHIDWPRYYIPLVMCISVMLAVGLDDMIDLMCGKGGETQ
jgi:hypothetical protein